ncbi:MAG: nucleotidyl transferase AbiEii/AbiGii toxin family protein [Terriglobia bacterium]
MLKQLFSIDALAGRLVFKGGTALSKVFHAINRFSEDIDLAVDYAALGVYGRAGPEARGDLKDEAGPLRFVRLCVRLWLATHKIVAASISETPVCRRDPLAS